MGYGSTAPVITEVVAAPSITTMAAPVTMAAPMMTEVVAAPAITTMAAPMTVAAPMVTEVIGSSAAGGAGLATSVSGGFGAGLGGAGVYGSTMATPLATTYGSLSTTSGSTGSCRHCGNHFMDDSNFCRKCGQPRY